MLRAILTVYKRYFAVLEEEQKMKALKKLTAVVAVLALTVGMATTCFGATWHSYFGLEEGWYEGAEGKLTKNTADSWTANMLALGWGGIWGCQVDQKVSLAKGEKYHIKCTLKSTKCDKWVFIKISTKEDFAYGKWVWLKKGKSVTVDEEFVAKAKANQITFGMGGEYGDRAETDGTKHYSFVSGGAKAIAKNKDGGGDPTVATQVICTGYVLEPVKAASAGGSQSNSTNNATAPAAVSTGDFTPVAYGAVALLAAAAIVAFARKREND